MTIQNLNDLVFAVDKKELSVDEQYNNIRRICQQGRQVSQIIAYIWRWVDDERPENKHKQEVANELQKYFKKPTENNQEPGGRLKKLLGAHPEDSSHEGNLLYDVFFENYSIDNEGYIFPIFNKLELGEDGSGLGYFLNIDINSYHGSLSDTSINHPYKFIHTIPYPARPQLSKATVTPDELEDWIKNRIPNKYYADNPYIPTTSS
jgi:flavodoxin